MSVLSDVIHALVIRHAGHSSRHEAADGALLAVHVLLVDVHVAVALGNVTAAFNLELFIANIN